MRIWTVHFVLYKVAFVYHVEDFLVLWLSTFKTNPLSVVLSPRRIHIKTRSYALHNPHFAAFVVLIFVMYPALSWFSNTHYQLQIIYWNSCLLSFKLSDQVSLSNYYYHHLYHIRILQNERAWQKGPRSYTYCWIPDNSKTHTRFYFLPKIFDFNLQQTAHKQNIVQWWICCSRFRQLLMTFLFGHWHQSAV